MNVLNAIKSRLYPTYRKYFSRVYLYEGTLKSGNGTAKCLFVDNDKYYLMVLQKLFMESPILISTFRCWIPGLRRLIKSPTIDFDICFANVSLRYAPLFNDSATFVMQTRVKQTLDISYALEANKRYRHQKNKVEKKINKNNLTFRVSHSLEDFIFFYHRMYQPLIKKYGDAAIVDSYDEMKLIFDKGLLVLVLYKGEPVSGSLSYEDKGLFLHRSSGLLDGDRELLNMGVMSATYFFLLEYARNQGFQKVDFMRCLPFLNDGVYMHKQEWGAKTEPLEVAPSGVFLFKRCNPEIFGRIILNIPLIVHTNNGLEGVISVAEENALTPELAKKLTIQYGRTGLSGLQILKKSGAVEYLTLIT